MRVVAVSDCSLCVIPADEQQHPVAPDPCLRQAAFVWVNLLMRRGTSRCGPLTAKICLFLCQIDRGRHVDCCGLRAVNVSIPAAQSGMRTVISTSIFSPVAASAATPTPVMQG